MRITAPRIGDVVVLTIEIADRIVEAPMTVTTALEVADLLRLTAAGYGDNQLDDALARILDEPT